MKELSPAARDLLSLARNAGAPTAAARARVEEALLERIASPIAAGTMAGKVTAGKLSAGVASGKAAAGFTSVTAKVLFVAGVSGAVIALGLELSTPSIAPRAVTSGQSMGVADAPTSPRSAEVPARSVVPAPESQLNDPPESGESKQHPAVSRSNRKLAPTAISKETEAPRTRGPSPVSLPVERAERDSLAQPAKPSEAERREGDLLPSPQPDKAPTRRNPTDQLDAEAQGLRGIQRALRDGNGQTALELIANDSARFPSGVLHQERAAAKVQALCMLGRAEAARTEAESFERRWPRSSLLARVRSACR